MPTPSILQKTLSSMRKHARRTRLVKAVNARPLDPRLLKELREEMVFSRGEWPQTLLWKINENARKVLSETPPSEVKELLTEIQRGANWELQSRARLR